MQYVEIELDPQEVFAEAGSFMMMDNGIKMETIFGDGSNNDNTGKLLLHAGKRVLTGESLYDCFYKSKPNDKRKVSLHRHILEKLYQLI
jgi:uncharacterized protein (AIM24 family)